MSFLIETLVKESMDNNDFMFVDVEKGVTPPMSPLYLSEDDDNSLITNVDLSTQEQRKEAEIEHYLCIDVGFRNLSWCVMQQSKNGLTRTIMEHGVACIYSTNKSLRGPLDWEEINLNIRYLFGEDLNLLNKYSDFLEGIYIERQPRRNFNGCLLAASIFAYFSHAAEDNPFWGKRVPVAYMDSRKKLGPLTLLPLDTSQPTKTYYQRKKEAIRRVNELLENECVIYSDELLSKDPTFQFQNKKKKDDLADSLLMCYVKACENEKLIDI